MTENIVDKMILKIQTPVNPESLLVTSNNNTQELRKNKPKANRPPPTLIKLNTDEDPLDIKRELVDAEDHIVIHETDIKVEKADPDDPDYEDTEITEGRALSIAPKPTMTLLSDEAKKIFNTSAPVQTRRGSNSNPRAHRYVAKTTFLAPTRAQGKAKSLLDDFFLSCSFRALQT